MRTLSAYIPKGNQNHDALFGEHDLIGSGLTITNPKYVTDYGKCKRLLRKLRHEPMTARNVALAKLYERQMQTAKFWATYSGNADALSPNEKRRIKQKFNFQQRV